ncbi:MAG TPA: sel1 repeat family protein, partial [Gammaproteobacteria bacterium]|nr:sel1 repeat family protein [Gammaproteobacteria bacterium]
KSAEQGYGPAQMDLGVAYYSGKGIVADSVTAYAWFHLAAQQGVTNAQKNKATVYSRLLPEDRRRAVDLATEFSRKYSNR